MSIFRHLRTTLAPAFHFDYIKEMVPMMLEKSKETLALVPQNEVVDFRPFITNFAIDVLGTIKYGELAPRALSRNFTSFQICAN